MLIEQFLGNLNSETGYKFGSPWRYSDKSLGVIVPILKIGDAGEREYVTLEEVDKKVIFKDSGHIEKVIVEGSWTDPIFIRSGTILKSKGTQSRAVESSVVIVPKKEKVDKKEKVGQVIPVRCIYMSKGIRTGETFSRGGDAPMEVRRSLLSRHGQASTWAAVGHATHRLMSSRLESRVSYANSESYGSSGGSGEISSSFKASHDDLAGIMEDVDKFTDNIDEILKKVPLFEDQVGAVFLDMKDVVGMELFDHPKSWEAIHKEVEKRLGESVTKEEEKTFFKPDYEQVKPLALNFLKKLIDSEKIETSKSGDIYSVTFLKGEGVVGEATSINGKVIHLVGMKVDTGIKNIHEETHMRTDDILRSIGGPRIGSYRSRDSNYRVIL